MSTRDANAPRSRIRSALFGPARLRDSIAVIGIALVCAGVIFGALFYVFDAALRRWSDGDLAQKAHLIGLAVESRARDAAPDALQSAVTYFASRPDPAYVALCGADGALIAGAGMARALGCGSEIARTAIHSNGAPVRRVTGDRSIVVTAHSLDDGRTLLVAQDRTFVDARRKQILRMVFASAEFGLLALLLLARAGARIGSRRTAEAARSIVRRMRSHDEESSSGVPSDLRPLVRDVHDVVEHLRHETPADASAGPERLRALVQAGIGSGGLVVIANREPYAHEWTGDGAVTIQRPASGLVTAIEPILRACGGTWIAHGGGSADRVHSDRRGRLAVPPGAPEYTLRRIWIGEVEYDRYYSGFANEGLWPLCHIAHTQPAFRAEDWLSYQAVNETFAQAAVEEARARGLLLVQDYHFALVPRLVREQAPHIVTSLFWHIPWPNSEMVGICPWKETLMEGMLGADILGFHTRQYCLNFLESAQRHLECRVDFDDMSVMFGGHRTVVRPYPISVEWPYRAASRADGCALRDTLRIPAGAHVTLGVDRADYTKGLVERVGAVETLLEDNPDLRGRFVFVQLASPTRTRIRRYRQLGDELREAVERVNQRFGTESWTPILLQMRTFSSEEVRLHYAMADSALVTPLHDGMNLVAKEYAAACSDGNGVLILSSFAGAAKELEGALIVNPYDTRQVAQAILRATRMPLAERKARMQAMREQIASSSIYHWSENLIRGMFEVRQQRSRFWPQRAAAERVKARENVAV